MAANSNKPRYRYRYKCNHSAAGTLECLLHLVLFATVVRLEVLADEEVTTASSLSEEWGSGWRGTNFLVEVEQTAPMSPPSSSSASSNGSEDYMGELSSQEVDEGFTTGATTGGASNSSTAVETGPKIIVRTEEVLIVGLVLVLWVGAIMLFFNRWGKIRMLEPYQPKFQQQHRSSCPLVDLDAVQTHQRSSVSRMSMGMVHNLNMPTCQFAAYNPNIYAKGYASHVSQVSRPRQNSVFVGASTSHYLMPRPPRKTRSAMDLHSMVLDESAEQV
ncbi:uncharacterized protein [Drosophila kikkawai]|uniref:Fibronectin type III domain-containing protein n=1 Tax=Drosophila kikkawai TaxID=30033 RepID=A0A6P4IJD6_DROKI|nr:uncharacterized protein LOC108074952 [Drosophila kikkawai]